jgi:tetratricopeptide (TPR) repeat protein/predicted Ser/Thr protein kinase
MRTEPSKTVQTIGKYQVQRVLGHGGMGTVYEALDPVLNRKVAIKTMMPGFAEAPELRLRFLREAQAAGGLRHRNIVTVYDLGDDKGEPYIAMEFIEGTDLEKIIQKKEPLSIERKLDVIRQICEGLGYAHKAGIVHRDVKPANIRLTPEGEVKIMDFGIAHLQSSTMTKGGLVMGTVHYMAPEQIQGRKVDHRSDIFSVGAIAYELIAFRRPFEGDSLTSVMFRIMHEEADPARLPQTEYTPGLEAIVLRALARDPETRYASLDDMRSDLERLVRDTAPRLIQRSEPGVGDAVPENAAPAEPAGQPGEAAAEALRLRVEREMAEIRAEIQRARAAGQLQKALLHARRLLELDPDDPELGRAAAEIEASIHEKELEQLSEMALSYAADGDLELALKIAARIERMAPDSPRYHQLRAYLDEERARRHAKALTACAGDQLAEGELEQALALAEEALRVYPSTPAAREIRERVAGVLAAQGKRVPEGAFGSRATVVPEAPVPPEPDSSVPEPAAAPAEAEPRLPAAAGPTLAEGEAPFPPPDPPPPAAGAAVSAAPPLDALTPLPEGTPANPEAAALVDSARRLLRDRAPEQALPLLEQAAAVEPAHAGLSRLLALTRIEARKARLESLTTAALDHFVRSDHRLARAAVEQALLLDPQNRKARELHTILEALG